MGRIFQQPPKKGDPISRAGIAEGLEKIDHVLTKMYVASGGSVDWALGYPRFRFSGGGGGGETNQTWAIEIDNANNRVKCSNCHLMISVLTVSAAGDLSIALNGDGGWLCAQYNTLSKMLNLYFGDAQVAYDPASQLVLVPLYRLVKDDDNWQVELDARNMPRIGVYL